MRLELSEDKKRISLTMIDKDKNEQKENCKLMSWKIPSLKEVPTPKEVLEKTGEIPLKSNVKAMKFVGKDNCCILQVIQQTYAEPNEKKKFLTYRIFDAKTGVKLLDWSNNKSKDDLKVLCLLTNAKVS